MGLHVLVTFSDDTVGIMTRAPSSEFDERGVRYRTTLYPNPTWVEGEIAKWRPTEEERALGRTGWCDGIEVIRHRVIHSHDVPGDRFYRDAWCERGGAIVHDMARAREIHRAKIRVVREALFRVLDVEYVRAMEDRPVLVRADRIVLRKVALRDLPQDPRIDEAQTIEELGALWPFGEQAATPVMVRRALDRRLFAA